MLDLGSISSMQGRTMIVKLARETCLPPPSHRVTSNICEYQSIQTFHKLHHKVLAFSIRPPPPSLPKDNSATFTEPPLP